MRICTHCHYHVSSKRVPSGHGCTREAPISVITGHPVPFDCHDERFNEWRGHVSLHDGQPVQTCGSEGRYWKAMRPV